MIKTLKDCVVTNKNVFVRSDLNVPVENGKVADDTRIKDIIPTLEYLIQNEAKIILASHLGSPKGKNVKDLSLKPVFEIIQKLLPNIKMYFAEDCIGKKTRKIVENAEYGEIIFLENLRFHKGEEENDIEFARELASLANLYVNDAFSCSHRKHASIVALPSILNGCLGFHAEKEINELKTLVQNAKRPQMLLLGGSKISTKISLLRKLVRKMDYIIIGGGIANTFLEAQGYEIGKSINEEEFKSEALEILKEAKKNGSKVILPEDVLTCTKLKENSNFVIKKNNELDKKDIICDIGNDTARYVVSLLKDVKTIIYNGPFGVYELERCRFGTQKILNEIANLTKEKKLVSILGGGNTIAAIKTKNKIEDFTYVSSAGGAFLKWLENGELVGIEVLNK